MSTSRAAPHTSTGILGLDLLLHGGLPHDRMHLIEGEPGTGKTDGAAVSARGTSERRTWFVGHPVGRPPRNFTLARDPLRYRRPILGLKDFFSRHPSTVLLLDDHSSGEGDLQLRSLAQGVLLLEPVPFEYGPRAGGPASSSCGDGRDGGLPRLRDCSGRLSSSRRDGRGLVDAGGAVAVRHGQSRLQSRGVSLR